VQATTRDSERAARLAALGLTPIVTSSLLSRPLPIDQETAVLVTFPPDGTTDRAIAPQLVRARSVAYVSSSIVYGDAHGRVDESTPADGRTPRARARLDAESVYRDLGAAIVRAPAIYGPGRGLHLRLAAGTLRLAGDGHNIVSRVHVEDLASALVELLLRGTRDALFVAGDRLPAPHVDVIRFLCETMHLPMPPHAPAEEADETLRSERALDPSLLWQTLGFEPRFPTYREGYRQCLAVDRVVSATAP
jgi:nucleoside-diphosphate-sugar epimerase